MVCETEELDKIFEALANSHRRSILYSLELNPRSISQLTVQEKLSFQAIYKHIRVLESSNLITRKKSGRTTFLALNNSTLKLLQVWLSRLHKHWVYQGDTLQNYVTGIKGSEWSIKEVTAKH